MIPPLKKIERFQIFIFNSLTLQRISYSEMQLMKWSKKFSPFLEAARIPFVDFTGLAMFSEKVQSRFFVFQVKNTLD